MEPKTFGKYLSVAGFEACLFPPDSTECDNCNKDQVQLYWRSTDSFSQDGEYFCEACIVAEGNANIKYGNSLTANPEK
jgi:uncharacterized protein CbrC (UPF0167 family)